MFAARSFKTLVAVGAGAGLVASTHNAVVYAEGAERKQKLPIYDEPEPEMMVKEEPTRLDEALRAARKETDRQILGMKYHLQMVTNKVVDLEKEAESNIKSVLVKEEEVMPAALYVIVAGFAGSIAASRRNILLRFLTPVAFSAMAFGYFFPASSNRLIEQANKSDFQKYLPSDLQNQFKQISGQAQQQESKIVAQVKEAAKEMQEIAHKAEDKLEEKIAEAVKAVEETKAMVVEEAQKVEKKVEEKVVEEEDTRKRV